MGGYVSGFAGQLGDDWHERHVQALQTQIDSKRNLLDNYKTLLEDPHMADVHGDIIGNMLKAASTDPTKLSKALQKPNGEFDPTKWQVLAQQRHAGQVPSPVNQGQNPTQIPAAPVQHDGTPGGQAQTAAPWNQASQIPPSPAMGQQQQQTDESGQSYNPGLTGLAVPPPPGASASPQSAHPAELAGNMGAQAVNALPPTPGAPAPNGVEVASPQQASAVAGSTPVPAPPGFQYGPVGNIPDDELKRRTLSYQSQIDEASQQAQMRRMVGEAQTKAQIERGTRAQQIKDLQEDGTWDTLTSREKAAIRTGVQTLGTTPRMLSAPGIVPGSSAQQGQLDMSGNPVDPNGSYHLRPRPDGEFDWIPQQVAQKLEWAADPDNPQRMKLFQVNPYNPSDKKAVTDISKVNPSMIPSVTNATQWKQVTQPDGSIALEPVQVSSTRTKTAAPPSSPSATPSPAAPPPGNRSAHPAAVIPPPPGADPSAPTLPRGSFIGGGRPLTPEQVITNGQKLGALDNTIEIVKRVQGNMPMLGNLIDAGKIQMQIDPHQGIFKAFLNRSVPMSPKEAELAGDFASLMEHINTLRGPLGATGFRGEEAFNALQAQRGQLMANPAVTSQVLANTLKALNRTRSPIAQGLKRAGQDPDQQVTEPSPSPGAGVPSEVKALLGASGVKPGIHKLSDGSSWLKGPDGTITKQ